MTATVDANLLRYTAPSILLAVRGFAFDRILEAENLQNGRVVHEVDDSFPELEKRGVLVSAIVADNCPEERRPDLFSTRDCFPSRKVVVGEPEVLSEVLPEVPPEAIGAVWSSAEGF